MRHKFLVTTNLYSGYKSLSFGQALALPLRVGWKLLTATNTLSFYGIKVIIVVKSFVVQALLFKPLSERSQFNYNLE
jgi:hypothetical protein